MPRARHPSISTHAPTHTHTPHLSSQLRPWEVLGEEWLALNKAGTVTPKIAIWQNLQDPAGDLWEAYVNGSYSDPEYEDLVREKTCWETRGKSVGGRGTEEE